MARRRARETVLRFDSSQRTSGDNETPTFTLEKRITNVHMVELRKIILPNTDYPITELNNQVAFIDTDLAPYLFTIPPGAYTPTTLATALKSALDTNAINGAPWTVEFRESPDFKLFVMSGDGLPFSFATPATIYDILGIPPTGQTSVGDELLAANVYDLSGPNYVIVKSPQLSQGSTDFSHFANSSEKSPVSTTDIMEVSYKTADFGVSILSDYNTKLRLPFHGILSTVDFSLEYPNGDPVLLNGRSWMVEIRVRHSR